MVNKRKVSDAKTFNYIRAQLDGGRGMAKHIAKSNIETGEVVAYVPEGLNNDQLFTFERGGIYPTPERVTYDHGEIAMVPNNAKSIILDEIMEFLLEKDDNCCLFEDPLSKRNDRFDKSSEMEFVYDDTGGLYYFFDNINITEVRLQQAFRASEAYVFLCALASLDLATRHSFNSSSQISDESLDKFCEHICSFYIRAYDGEGYLRWQNTLGPK